MHHHLARGAVITLRALLAAALAAATLAIPGHASARPAPSTAQRTHPHPFTSQPPAAAPTNSSGAKPPG